MYNWNIIELCHLIRWKAKKNSNDRNMEGYISLIMEKSKLLIKTFDGTMKKCAIKPKCTKSKVEFIIKYYDEEDKLKKGLLVFEQVIAVDIEVNYFDNPIGAELSGFYEIFDINAKEGMIEKLFKNRREGYLYHGDYNYEPYEENDMLNYREPIIEIVKEIDDYRLFQQQTQGGLIYILAKEYKFL